MKPALVLPGGHLDWCPWTQFDPKTLRAQAPCTSGVYVVGVRTSAGDEYVPVYVGSSVKLQKELLQYAYTYYVWHNSKPLAQVLRRIEPERHVCAWAECDDCRAVERVLIRQYWPGLVNSHLTGTHPNWSPYEQAQTIIDRLRDHSRTRVELADHPYVVSYEGPLDGHVCTLHLRDPREYGFRVYPEDARLWFEVRPGRVTIIAEVAVEVIGQVAVIDAGRLSDWHIPANPMPYPQVSVRYA